MSTRLLLPILLTVMACAPAWAQQQASPRRPAATGARLAPATLAENRGFFASVDYLSYNASTAVDAQGGVHLAFYFSNERHQDDPPGQPAFYTYCPGTADCTDPASYELLIQFDTQVNEVQVVATPDGRPRLLVRRNGSRGHDYHYWACEEDCLDPDRWAGLYVTEGMGVDLFSAEHPQHSFALDARGRPRFVYSNGWGNGKTNAINYAYCDAADCTEPGSWQETHIRGPYDYFTVTSDYASLVFDGEKPRVLTRFNRSGLPVQLEYYACDEHCDDQASWGGTAIPHPDGDRQWANWDLMLDAQGRPRIALYEPAGIDIFVSGKLFYGWCDEDCTGENAFQITQVASGEGKNVDLAQAPDGRTYMVYDAGQRGVLGTVWCDGDCSDAGRWRRQIIETSERLNEQFAPASPLSCAQNEQEGRAWLDAIPQVAFDAQGRLVVAYDVKNVAVCYYYDPARPGDPIQTRVERIWWAVRLGFYAKPDAAGTPVEDEPEVPATLTLHGNFPNPFNPSTTLRFDLPEASRVEVVVYDAVGREVRRLVDDRLEAGSHQVAFEADGLTSGVYLYRVTAGAFSRTGRMVLLK